jgi:curved DNA-binding protein
MNYYDTLGVQKGASQDEIKKAYRSLAMKHHPDRGGDTAKFKEIQEAYDTLGDEQKRSGYDQPQQAYHQHNSGFGFPPGFDAFFGHSQFSDLFRPHRSRNRDLNFGTRISLEDAFYGKEMVFSFIKANGQEKIVNVKIPAGIHNGMTLRLSGMGDDTLSGLPAGDVLITVEVMNHHEFVRQGDDLIKEIDIDCFDAMLGSQINITTIDGKTLTGNVPAGTQHDAVMAIADHGMPNVNNSGSRGRLLLQLKIKIPTISEQQKEAIRKIIK